MEITLARALKYKNRLVGKIATVTEVIRNKNSVVKGTEKEVDINDLFKLRLKLVKNLIDLKTAINKANESIVSDIYNLSEIKSLMSIINSVDTTHGKSSKGGGYYGANTEPVEYESQMRFTDAEEMLSSGNKQIDQIQEKIDKHNHLITINVEMLDEIY